MDGRIFMSLARVVARDGGVPKTSVTAGRTQTCGPRAPGPQPNSRRCSGALPDGPGAHDRGRIDAAWKMTRRERPGAPSQRGRALFAEPCPFGLSCWHWGHFIAEPPVNRAGRRSRATVARRVDRRTFITVAATWFAAPLAAAGKVYRVGLIFTTLPVFEVDATPGGRALLEGLRQLGYEEGRNLVLERRSAEGKRERYLEIAAELVRLKTDVIVTIGTFMTPPSPRDYPRQAHEDAPRACSGRGPSEHRREHRKDSSLVMRSPSQNRQACTADGRCQEPVRQPSVVFPSDRLGTATSPGSRTSSSRARAEADGGLSRDSSRACNGRGHQ